MRSQTLEAMLQMVRKDLMILVREPFYLFVSLVLPLFFFLLFNLISAGSATQPIAIARDSQGPWSDRLISIMAAPPEGRRAGEQPYWEIITTDPVEARRLYENNQVMGLVIIPADFDEAIAAGRQAKVRVEANNINSDYTKNIWFRMDHNILALNREITKNDLVTIQEEAWLPRDVAMLLYMAASLVVYAFFYGGMVNTAAAVAREWDDGTAKEILLSPHGLWGLVGGKLLVGLGQTFISGTIVLVATWLFAGFVPQGPWWAILSLLTATAIMGTGIGALVGVWQRRVLPSLQFCIVLSLIVFLLGSGLSPLSGVAWSGVTEAMYRFSMFLPPTYAFISAHVLLNGGLLTGIGRDLLVIGLTGLVAAGLAGWMLMRAFKEAPRVTTT